LQRFRENTIVRTREIPRYICKMISLCNKSVGVGWTECRVWKKTRGNIRVYTSCRKDISLFGRRVCVCVCISRLEKNACRKNRSIPFGSSEDECEFQNTAATAKLWEGCGGRWGEVKPKIKRGRISCGIHICAVGTRIRAKGCARVVCRRRHFNRPSFPPSNCPLPPDAEEFLTYIQRRIIYIRVHDCGTRVTLYIYIYIYMYIPANDMYYIYLRSFRAKVLLHDSDTYKGTFTMFMIGMYIVYICAHCRVG